MLSMFTFYMAMLGKTKLQSLYMLHSAVPRSCCLNFCISYLTEEMTPIAHISYTKNLRSFQATNALHKIPLNRKATLSGWFDIYS